MLYDATNFPNYRTSTDGCAALSKFQVMILHSLLCNNSFSSIPTSIVLLIANYVTIAFPPFPLLLFPFSLDALTSSNSFANAESSFVAIREYVYA